MLNLLLTMKIILVFPFNLLAHYLRCLVLAQKYDKEEYRILFLESSNYDKFVKEAGFETFSCLGFDADHVTECARRFDFSWLSLPEMETIMLAQTIAIERYQAIAVIGDVSPTLKMAAELKGVKYISLINGYLSRYYMQTRRLPKSHRSHHFFKILPTVITDLITDFAESIVLRKVHRPFREIRKKYALKNVTNYLSEIEGDENIICDDQHLFPQKSLPKNYHFIGPLIYTPRKPEGLWLSQINIQKPVICVCMGSTGDWNKLDFLNDSYYAKYTVITAGDKTKVLHATHIISRDFINLHQVLQKANLMICHGGNGTIYTGIVNRVFMLCLPSHFEQEWNITAIERMGYGKSVNRNNSFQWKTEIIKALNK